MGKKKLLIVSGRLSTGGAERFVSNLLTFLDRSLFEPYLVLCLDSIEYHLPADIQPHILENNNPLLSFRSIHRLVKLIDGIQPDIVLSNIALTNRLTGSALRLSRHKPKWIARIGNHPARGGRSRIRNSLNIAWDRLAYPKADHFVVNSKGLLHALHAVHPFTKGKTTVLYNPIDFEALTQESKQAIDLQPAKGFTFLHVGRFHRQKRHDLLLQAFSRVVQQHERPVELWLLGDGYLRNDIEQLAKNLSIEEHVRFLGHVENPYPVFRLADGFILTSDWEGMPNTLIEALGLGLPSISTDCSFGPNEVLRDGVNGYLAQTGNVADIADKLLKLLDSHNLDDLSENAKRSVISLFDYKKIIEKWQQLLSE